MLDRGTILRVAPRWQIEGIERRIPLPSGDDALPPTISYPVAVYVSVVPPQPVRRMRGTEHSMYIPEHFAINSPELLHQIIHKHPLGVLVTLTPDGLDANHIPFEFDATQGDMGRLTAHVARANPVWKQCGNGADVLVIFRGEESYISPNWYPSKHETHRQVPTWNYEVVHAYGKLAIQDEDKFVRGVVARLTRTHEASEPKPWKMGDSAPEYIDAMLKAIVGIEIAITRLEGKAKLSQNRESRDRLHAADVLARNGETGLAQSMRSVG
jgi:transcriptional regulator